MREWMKYLVIGWSIVCIGIILITFQIMKKDFIKEDYSIRLPLCEPPEIDFEQKTPTPKWTIVERFLGKSLYETNSERLTKKEFIERLKGTKGIEIKYQYDMDEQFFLLFPIYVFLVWFLPILVFSLLGLLFSKKK